MTDCQKRGCRLLETKCKDCGRVVVEREFKPPGEWISVKDRLPEEGLEVLTLDNRNSSRIEYRLDYIIKPGGREFPPYIWACILHDEWNTVTHWQPLPEPPKE